MTFGEFLFVSVVVGVFILLWIHFGQGNSMIKLLVIPLIIGLLLRFTWGIFGAIVVLATIPLVLSEFYVTLLNYIGLASIVTIGLVLLTGVAGLTSFGQAAFVGIGAYTTAVLTTAYGLSPWLTLPLSLLVLVGAGMAVILGLVNFGMTIVSMFLIDRLGRKTTIVIGLAAFAADAFLFPRDADRPSADPQPACGRPVGQAHRTDLVEDTERTRGPSFDHRRHLGRTETDGGQDGRIGVVRVKRSSGYASLDNSALEAVRAWRFEPARRMGAAVDAWVEIPIRFKLSPGDSLM